MQHTRLDATSHPMDGGNYRGIDAGSDPPLATYLHPAGNVGDARTPAPGTSPTAAVWCGIAYRYFVGAFKDMWLLLRLEQRIIS